MHYALGDYVLDIAQNAVEAGSTKVYLLVDEEETGTKVVVEDDGAGMSDEELKRALDPFYTDGRKHAGRKVGLGLPFLVQATEQAGGDFGIKSEKGRGTRVSFRFPLSNVDSPPMGDIPGLFLSLLCLPGGHEMIIERRKAGASGFRYRLTRSELSEAVGGLEKASSLALLREYLASQEEDEDEGTDQATERRRSYGKDDPRAAAEAPRGEEAGYQPSRS